MRKSTGWASRLASKTRWRRCSRVDREALVPLVASLEVVELDIGGADRVPAIPRDAQDDERDDEPDDRVCNLESERDDRGRGDDTKADEPVHTGMLAVGDERGTSEPISGTKANLCCDLISDEPDHTSKGKKPQVRQRAWVDKSLDRLAEGDKRADEDREHHY